MKFFGLSVLLSLLLVALLQAASTYSQINVTDGGTIRGTVVWKSDFPPPQKVPVTKDQKVCGTEKTIPDFVLGPNRGVPNAVVYLDGITAGKKFKRVDKVQLDQNRCEYVPHVLIVPPGAQVEMTNSDSTFHNVHTYNVASDDYGHPATMFNLAFPIQGQKVTKKLEPGMILALCDGGHPWMNAHIFVTEHPYYALTDANGNFVLDDVPPGTYKLKMWQEGIPKIEHNSNTGFLHEEPKVQTKQVTVNKKQTVTIDFTL